MGRPLILPKYDITVRVTDPDDPETMVEATYRGCLRCEKLLTQPVIGAVVQAFETTIEIDDGT